MFSAPHFHNDEAARRTLEDIRWPDGRSCPHCGTFDRSYATKRSQKCGATVYRCGEPECRKDFSVTTKSVMESSHIPLHKWMQGFFLMASSKKGVSAHQLHRMLGITYKAAWFMAHRIREAMRADGTFGPLGGEGMTVEADETYYGYVFHTVWLTTDVCVDWAIGHFLGIPAKDTHILLAGLEFGRKSRILIDLIKRSDHKKKSVLIGSLRTITNSKREVFAHSYFLSSDTRVGFINRNRSGEYKAKSYEYTAKEFLEHVAEFVTAAQSFMVALAVSDEVFEEFANAAVSDSKS